jgi:hypothetical protein
MNCASLKATSEYPLKTELFSSKKYPINHELLNQVQNGTSATNVSTGITVVNRASNGQQQQQQQQQQQEQQDLNIKFVNYDEYFNYLFIRNRRIKIFLTTLFLIVMFLTALLFLILFATSNQKKSFLSFFFFGFAI